MKSPAFQFYPQDFISSLDVQIMNVEQVGAYMLLLVNAWTQDPQGFLPNNDRLLQMICRMNDKQWAKNKTLVLKKFSIEGEFIFNPRLLQELEKQAEFRKKQAENGKKGGRPRKEETQDEPTENPKKPTAFSGETQTKPKKSSSSSSSFSSSEENIIGTNVPAVLSDFEKFDLIRKEYPGTKRGPKTEWDEFKKKFSKEINTDFLRTIWLGLDAKRKTHKELMAAGQFVPEWPHFKTYLNQRRWEEKTEVRETPSPEPKREPSAFKSLQEHFEYWGGTATPTPTTPTPA